MLRKIRQEYTGRMPIIDLGVLDGVLETVGIESTPDNRKEYIQKQFESCTHECVLVLGVKTEDDVTAIPHDVKEVYNVFHADQTHHLDSGFGFISYNVIPISHVNDRMFYDAVGRVITT